MSKKRVHRKTLRKNHYSDFYEQVMKVSPLVAKTLANHPETRDDDNRLCISIWKAQGASERDSIKSFKYKLVRGKYSTPETITRSRRRLQELYPTLRGTLYKQRHDAEERMRNQLKLF